MNLTSGIITSFIIVVIYLITPVFGDQAHVSFQKGMDYLNEEKYEKAIDEFDKVISSYDGKKGDLLTSSLDEKGYAYEKLGQYDNAIQAYKEAITAEIDNPVACPDAFYHRLANIYKKKKDYQNAIETLQKAIKIGKNDECSPYYSWDQLARVYEESGDNIKAIEAYQKSNTLSPSYYTWESIARLYKKIGEKKKSDLAYQSALGLMEQEAKNLNSDAYYWHHKGSYLTELNRTDEAQKAYEKAVELDPDTCWFWTPLANIYEQKGMIKQSNQANLAAIAACIKNPSTMTHHHNWLGAMYAKIGDNTSAQQEYSTGLEESLALTISQPEYAYNWVEVGRARKYLGDLPGAITAYNKAIEIEPDSYYWEELGETYEKEGDIGNALISYKQALKIDPYNQDIQDHIDNLPDSATPPHSTITSTPASIETPSTIITQDSRESEQKGILNIVTTPPGATLIIDGLPAGTTPYSSDSITVGFHALKIEKSGYLPLELSITVTVGEENKMSFTLPQLSSEITSTPEPTIQLKESHGEDLTVGEIAFVYYKADSNELSSDLTVKNMGTSPTARFAITYFLTPEQISVPFMDPDGQEIILGRDEISTLSAGESRKASTLKTFSLSGVLPGKYWFGVFVDSQDSIAETDEENNVRYWEEQIIIL